MIGNDSLIPPMTCRSHPAVAPLQMVRPVAQPKVHHHVQHLEDNELVRGSRHPGGGHDGSPWLTMVMQDGGAMGDS